MNILKINNVWFNLTLVNLHPNEYGQVYNLQGCVGKCNTLNDLSNRFCVSGKTEDLNLNVFNMITGINEPKTLT